MSGFQMETLNSEFKKGLYNLIISAVIKSCEIMVNDCSIDDNKLPNHEEKLRNHLLENYLGNDQKRLLIGLSGVAIGFIPEAPENYDSKSNTYIGRTDIKVVSKNWLSGNSEDYYIIECKRIDGGKSLNEKYIDEGICRFVDSRPKYSSYNHMNIMLAFVVQEIKCVDNVTKIADLHEEKLQQIICENIEIVDFFHEKNSCLCKSTYMSGITLNHIFYDFSRSIVS